MKDLTNQKKSAQLLLSKIKESGKSNSFVFDTSDLRDEMRAVKNAINKKQIAITDNSGRIVGSQSNNYRETYLNRMRNGR